MAGRPRKIQNELPVKEQVSEVKEPKVKKDILLLRVISGLEESLKEAKQEYSGYIASQRKEVIVPSVAECLKLSMRDDLNSDRRELKKVTGMALSKLKQNR
jgi:hypothetical protein